MPFSQIMRDDLTRRVYRLYDFTRALQITPDQYYCVSGKVNCGQTVPGYGVRQG